MHQCHQASGFRSYSNPAMENAHETPSTNSYKYGASENSG